MSRAANDPRTPRTTLVARDVRQAAKHAAAAVETFTRWAVLLEHAPERGERLIRSALVSAKREKSPSTPNPFLGMVAEETLAGLSAEAVAECQERAEDIDQKEREGHDWSVACWAVEVALIAYGHGKPDNAPPSEHKAHRRCVEAITSTSLSDDCWRNADALRDIMAGMVLGGATKQPVKGQDGNVVEVEFGGAS